MELFRTSDGRLLYSEFGLVIKNHREYKIIAESPQKQLFVASKNHAELTEFNLATKHTLKMKQLSSKY